MRARFLRWLLGWCMFPKCDCRLDTGEMKCFDSVFNKRSDDIGTRQP